MQYRPFQADIEVNGQTVYAIVDGFSLFKGIPSQILLDEGIGTLGPKGLVQIDPEAWYSQAAWLRAFERVGAKLGDANLYAIGLKIPENAKFPPSIVDVNTAIQSIDVAYHMNHRNRAGRVLFDPTTGKMEEGIGHYGFEKVSGANRIISKCENPYPCHFDRGILTAMAKRFDKRAQVRHDDTQPCRNRGAESCTYAIEW